jgi:hypothetical protein
VEEWVTWEDGSIGTKKLGCDRANVSLLSKR